MIVTREDIRQVLTAKVESLRSTFTAYPVAVEYKNYNTVNRSTQSQPFIAIDITYLDGEQIGLGLQAETRPMGIIALEAFDKEGGGTARMNALLDHFYRPLQKTDSMYPLRTYAARFSPRLPKAGWAIEAALIPFWYDTE